MVLIDQQLTRIAYSFLSKVLSPQILSFHRLITSIGRAFPATGRLFYNSGPRTVYQIIAEWIALQQKAGNIRDDADPYDLAILFHDMLIGDQQLGWLTSTFNEKDRTRLIKHKVRLAVAVFPDPAGEPAGGAGAFRRRHRPAVPGFRRPISPGMEAEISATRRRWPGPGHGLGGACDYVTAQALAATIPRPTEWGVAGGMRLLVVIYVGFGEYAGVAVGVPRKSVQVRFPRF